MDTDDESSSDTTEINKHVKRRRTGSTNGRSFCWKYFKPYPETMGIETKCTFPGCSTKYTWRGSTTNLKRHLEKIHKIIKSSTQVQSTNINSGSEINLPLVKFIISSNQSFNVVNHMVSAGFLNKPYQIPTTLEIEDQINKTYDKLFLKLKQMIQYAESVSLAIHVWCIDSENFIEKTYVEITSHWLTKDFKIHKILLCMKEFDNDITLTDRYIEQVIKKCELTGSKFITTNFGVEDELSVSPEFNNLEYIINATEFLESLLSTCLDQCLNIENQDILKKIEEIKKIIEEIPDIIKVLKEEEAQEELQKSLDDSIIFDIGRIIEGKWSFTYFGLKYIVLMEKQINNLVSNWCSDRDENIESIGNDLEELLPNASQFKLLSKLSQIFEPLELVEKIMNDYDYLTINFMQSILTELINKIKLKAINIRNELRSVGDILESDTILAIIDSIYNFLNTPNYFQTFFYDRTALIGNMASLLDPRFKSTYSSEVSFFLFIYFEKFLENYMLKSLTLQEAKKLVQDECVNFYSNQSTNNKNSKNNHKSSECSSTSVSDFFSDHSSTTNNSNLISNSNFTFLNETNSQKNLHENPQEKAIKDLDSYLALPQQQSIDPYEWWRKYKDLFPGLAILARKYLAIPATSYSTKLSKNEHKENLKIISNIYVDPDIVNKIVFLRHNKNYLDELF
ncbi:5232_t:CDS:1 [Scutellospora calospora]|uniref:5232_t:CDS:1 n=1 Tax=Scutellospora calospora TaxID=85575 RepID=A0ACA9K0Y3_9GLOM|nr:5232_t:CDS:1 [Scutellospora calospora]